ncbi:MAG: hypothetical protein K8T91_21695 [Planctomycetes bacterium]|nr:hypothetical protein [Planctomycetota bacterium]
MVLLVRPALDARDYSTVLRVPPIPQEMEVVRLLDDRQEGDDIPACLLCGNRLRLHNGFRRAYGLPIAQD